MYSRNGISMHLLKIRNGYLSFLRQGVRILLFALIIAGSAGLLSFPLWYWAIHGGRSFTWSVLLLIGGVFLFFMGKKLLRPSLEVGGSESAGGLSFTGLQRQALKLLKVLATLVLIYVTGMVFASFHFLWGIAMLLPTLYLIGLLFFR